MSGDFFYGDTAHDVFERLKHILQAGTSKELAHKVGISESGISSAIKRNSVPYALCAQTSLTTGVPVDWILFGDVDGKNHYRTIKSEYLQRAYGAADIDAKEQLAEIFGDSPEFDDADAVWVPLYDVEVSAGSGIEVYGERIIQRVPFAKSWLHSEGLYARHLACLPVHGDSMEPTLQHGDIVLVNHEKTRGDGVFVIRMGNALRVKRLQWLANGDLRISSDNAIYEPEQVNPDDLGDQFAILAACHTRISRVR